jgi:hypothetical protein
MTTKKRHSGLKRRNLTDKSKRAPVLFSQIGIFIYSHDLDRLLDPNEMLKLNSQKLEEDYN